jgi:hypothetical protein
MERQPYVPQPCSHQWRHKARHQTGSIVQTGSVAPYLGTGPHTMQEGEMYSCVTCKQELCARKGEPGC